MNTRLSQDAADSLQAHEQQQVWRNRARADYRRSQGAAMTGTFVFPPLTAIEQAERKQQITEGELPF
jgi:hypothetical protein